MCYEKFDEPRPERARKPRFLPRAGNIGKKVKEVEFEDPEETPAPVEEPSPVVEPVKVPART